MRYLLRLAIFAGLGLNAFSQLPVAKRPVVMPGTYTPADASVRADWWAGSTFGPTSWLTGAFSSGWSTIFNSPEEWERSPNGFARRLASRTANVAIANGVEASLGAVWGEDPRYVRKGEGSFGSRAGNVFKMTVMARYRDGSTKFAFARLIGNVSGNATQYTWMPPSATGPGAVSYNVAIGVSARLGSVAFQEFWPDVRKRLFKK
jgi:hypothetical protein